MSFFDFSADIQRAIEMAEDDVSRLCAGTTVRRASLPSAVSRAGYHFLSSGDSYNPGDHDLVIGVASWSDPDLALLDDLVPLTKARCVRVYVLDVDDWTYPEMVGMFPGLGKITRTPVVMQYKGGDLAYFGEGRDAVLWLRQF